MKYQLMGVPRLKCLVYFIEQWQAQDTSRGPLVKEHCCGCGRALDLLSTHPGPNCSLQWCGREC